MKLKCENCGEVIESGLANVMKHQFEDCKAAHEEKVPNCDWATYIVRPFIKLTPLHEKDTTNNNKNNTSL